MERLTSTQKDNRRRIVDITYRHKLSHLGSCLSAVDLIDAVYDVKELGERFVLSSGHAGLALYVVMERHGLGDAEEMLENQGIHPDRLADYRVDCSTGSLGQGLPIAVGMALANRDRQVYCQISDGECAEGSIWESLRIGSENELNNLNIVLNANGYGAYDEIRLKPLRQRIRAFGWRVINVDGHKPQDLRYHLSRDLDPIYLKDCQKPTLIMARTRVDQLPFLKGLDAHYRVLNEEQYKEAMECLR